MRDVYSYFTWYTAIHVNYQMNGLFCPSVKDMAPDKIMGHGWSQLQVGGYILELQSEMSNLLWKILAHEEMFPPNEGEILKEKLITAGGCGYSSLYIISKLCHHPALDTDYVTPNIYTQTLNTSFGKHVRTCESYIWGMCLKGDTYDQKRFLDTVLVYLHPKYKATFK